MASIRKRNGRWQARVIKKGYAEEVRSFGTRDEAERWGRSIEAEIDTGNFAGLKAAEIATLASVIRRYMSEVLPTLKGAKSDRIRLTALLREPMTELRMCELAPQRVARFRDDRLQRVSPGTVVRDLAYLSAIINHARREWGIAITNPVSLVRRPAVPGGRERVISEPEQAALLVALEPVGRRNPLMRPLVTMAIETAMRRGELLSLRWEYIDLHERTAKLLTSKNGEGRVVPLSTRAVETFISLGPAVEGIVFGVEHAAVSKAFEHATARAGLRDLRFHDLRHTAITRMAVRLPNVIELSAVSGHKSLSMLKRYYHPRPQDLALKLG
jgi:integrase